MIIISYSIFHMYSIFRYVFAFQVEDRDIASTGIIKPFRLPLNNYMFGPILCAL